MIILINIISWIFNVYSWIIVLYCVCSFIPPSAYANRFLASAVRIIYKLATPAFELLHSIIPRRFLTIGMIDLSPIVLIFILEYAGLGLQQLLLRLI